MKKLIAIFVVLFCSVPAFSQSSLKAIIKDAKTNLPLIGATALLKSSGKGVGADSIGLVLISGIPDGKQVIQFSYLGYRSRLDTLLFPLGQDPLLILLELENEGKGEELEEVLITATRSSRTIANIPTRVETISGEELAEKGNMKPGDIRMLLAESTGIQTQQTSATSANSSIRIQGLDGKYTQIIRDGFPLYSGFSGGLGLLQIAPLDLKQVEVIKGSSSTLYGGGAIAGLVNLVSRTPGEERELNFIANGTSALGLDLSGFYSQKFKKTGTTVYASYNHGNAYDPSTTGLTAIPEFDRFTLNPKLFVTISDRTSLIAGLNATVEKRIGGDLEYIRGNGSAQHSYFEENKTSRYSTQTELLHKLNDHAKLNFRNSVSYYDRSISLPGYRFSGKQVSTYSEATYSRSGEKADWVFGANFLSDHFGEEQNSTFPLRNYDYTTIGMFGQNTWDVSSKFALESGIRGDYQNEYGFFILPRISGLWKINSSLSTRLGAGLGYKAPTVFTEEAERIQFRKVLPLDLTRSRAEQSYGANYDINFRTSLFDKLGFSINQLFFYTRINNPIGLIPDPTSSLNLYYVQPSGNLATKGMETNIKVTWSDFKLFIGYTLADVSQQIGTIRRNYSLVSRHRLNNVLMYEVEDKWKIGAEAYYFSRQQLNDGATGRSYWTAGLMAEKLWERFSIFVNFENYTDTKQTKFDSIFNGNITSPVFRDIYAPLDGFVLNGGMKLKL